MKKKEKKRNGSSIEKKKMKISNLLKLGIQFLNILSWANEKVRNEKCFQDSKDFVSSLNQSKFAPCKRQFQKFVEECDPKRKEMERILLGLLKALKEIE